jgi:hypothetical protein
MKRLLILIAILGMFAMAYTQTTRRVCINGNQQFTSIQTAINASIAGDIVLVHPGHYNENIIISGKNITLTSLYSQTGDRNYIYETIIDGNQLSSVIRLEEGLTRQAVINGFTIQNGTGFSSNTQTYSRFIREAERDEDIYRFIKSVSSTTGAGGGLFISTGASPTIKNNVIKDNHTSGTGGGILIFSQLHQGNSDPLFSNNIIKNNSSKRKGGGIAITGSGATATFDPVSKNSVYNNIAGFGLDIFAAQFFGSLQIHLDMFSSVEWYGSFLDIEPFMFNFSAMRGYLEFIDSDLFVSPNGCDVNNTGTANQPFLTVSHAMRMIAPNPNNRNTIHVASGHYGKTLNNQFFPVSMKSYVNLVGVCRYSTIFDSEFGIGLITAPYGSNNFTIKNITFQNINPQFLYPHIEIQNTHGVLIENCRFRNGFGGIFDGKTHPISSLNQNSVIILRNLLFENNYMSAINKVSHNTTIENVVIRNHHPWFLGTMYLSFPLLSVNRFDTYHKMHYIQITNLLVYNNLCFGGTNIRPPILVGSFYHSNVLINHATIVNNNTMSRHANMPSMISVRCLSDVRIYNTIIYNNQPNFISIDYYWVLQTGLILHPVELHVNHTLYPGGIEYILYYKNSKFFPNYYIIQVHWGEGNIDDQIPIFVNCDNYPFSLDPLSPGAKAGTNNINWANYTPPTTDVFGRPRCPDNPSIGAVEVLGEVIPAPLFSVLPLSHSFQNVIVGESSAVQTFTMTNNGTAVLEVTSISLSGQNADEFNLVANNLPFKVASGGGSQTFTVSMTPTSAGNKTANVVINHNATGSPSTISLSGTGAVLTPTFSITPSSHNFQSIVIGETSDFETFTINNTGNANLIVSEIDISDEDNFNLLVVGLPFNISAGASRTFMVAMSPTSAGSKSANVVINHCATGSPATVTLSGIGLAPAEFSITPLTHAFGEVIVEQSSSPHIFVIRNTGGSPLTVSAINLIGQNRLHYFHLERLKIQSVVTRLCF